MNRIYLVLLSFCLYCNNSLADDIVFTSKDGAVLRLADLTDTSAKASPNSQNIPAAARVLFEEGVEMGKSGQYLPAIEKFKAASQIVPSWPYPYYQTGFTWLLQKNVEQALASYRKVDALEPRGFFTSKQEVFTLERELAGTYTQGLYLLFVSHEWSDDVGEKIKIMRRVIELVPDYAPAYQKLSILEEDIVKKLDLLERALTFQSDAETRGMLLLNKATNLHIQGDKDAAITILGELVLDGSTTKTVTAWAKKLLLQIYE